MRTDYYVVPCEEEPTNPYHVSPLSSSITPTFGVLPPVVIDTRMGLIRYNNYTIYKTQAVHTYQQTPHYSRRNEILHRY